MIFVVIIMTIVKQLLKNDLIIILFHVSCVNKLII